MTTDIVRPREESAADRWARFRPIRTGDDYVESLRGRGVEVWLFGEQVEEPVDHPIIRPSINALKMTYDLAIDDPELATAHSELIDAPVNGFLHIVGSPQAQHIQILRGMEVETKKGLARDLAGIAEELQLR